MSIQIGNLAKITQVNIQTIRFYEREGLLPEPERTIGGFRLYHQIDADRIRFIKQAQSLGFSLDEIKELLSLRVEPDSNCMKVKQQAEEKIDQMKIKISELECIVATLENLVDNCVNRQPTEICPILGSLESNANQEG